MDGAANQSYCLAIEGRSWGTVYQYFPEVLQKVLVRGAIFARMSPEQKQQLVMELEALGYYVGELGFTYIHTYVPDSIHELIKMTLI